MGKLKTVTDDLNNCKGHLKSFEWYHKMEAVTSEIKPFRPIVLHFNFRNFRWARQCTCS